MVRVPPVTTIAVEDVSPEQLADWRRNGVVLLVGSWVSTYSPTSLASGISWSAALWNLLFATWNKLPKDECRTALEDDFKRMPFEALMEAHPDRRAIRRTLRVVYSRPGHNPVHECIAEALVDGDLCAIITTNYDLGLDDCLNGAPSVITLHNEQTCKEYREGTTRARPFFKIHGTATEEHEKDLVCDLSSEGRLPDHKRALLHDLLQDRTVVVVGYSGPSVPI